MCKHKLEDVDESTRAERDWRDMQKQINRLRARWHKALMIELFGDEDDGEESQRLENTENVVNGKGKAREIIPSISDAHMRLAKHFFGNNADNQEKQRLNIAGRLQEGTKNVVGGKRKASYIEAGAENEENERPVPGGDGHGPDAADDESDDILQTITDMPFLENTGPKPGRHDWTMMRYREG